MLKLIYGEFTVNSSQAANAVAAGRRGSIFIKCCSATRRL